MVLNTDVLNIFLKLFLFVGPGELVLLYNITSFFIYSYLPKAVYFYVFTINYEYII